MDMYCKTIKSRFNSNNDGFVMVTALSVVFLIVSIVASVILITSADLKSNARARAIVTNRFAAESASDLVFSYIARAETGLLAKAQELDPLSGGDSFTTEWYEVGTNGAFVECTNISHECFIMRVMQRTTTPTGGSIPRAEIVLHIIVRSNCRGTLSSYTGCIYRKFQQRYRIRTFIDSVLLTDQEIDNTTGRRVAFLPSDDITGIVHTNDEDGFTYCGSVDVDATFKNPNADSEQFTETGYSCTGTLPTVELEAEQVLPGQITATGNNLTFPSVYQELATGVYEVTGNATITLTNTRVTINGTQYAYPPNGVIYVSGTATISGEYSRSLTIYGNNVTIGGNITYRSENGAVVVDGTNPSPPDFSAILGIATNNDITLSCTPTSGPQRGCAERKVVAVLNAKLGTVRNAQWSTATVASGQTANAFYLYGAIIARYRPVFGAYSSVSNGALISGWRKNLVYDPRLEDKQPPYFFRTTQANISRSALDESPCGNPTYCPTT